MSCALDLMKQIKVQLHNSSSHVPLAVYLTHHKNNLQPTAMTSQNSSVLGKTEPIQTLYTTISPSQQQKKSLLFTIFNSIREIEEKTDDNEHEDSEQTLMVTNPKIDFYCEKSKTDLIDILGSVFLGNNPLMPMEVPDSSTISVSKPTRMKSICDYTNILHHYSQHLFNILQETLHSFKQIQRYNKTSSTLNYPVWYFNLLQKFHVALEETNFPFPAGFVEHFASIGVQVLPLRSLLQYIKRDIFVVTDKVVKDVMKKWPHSQEDMEWSCLMRTLIQKLKDREFRDVFYYEKMLSMAADDRKSSEHSLLCNLLLNYYHGLIVEHIDNISRTTNVKSSITSVPLENIQFLEDLNFKLQRERESHSQSLYPSFFPLCYFLVAVESLNSGLLPKPTLLKVTHQDSDDDASGEDEGTLYTDSSTPISFHSLLQRIEYCYEDGPTKYVTFLREKSESVLRTFSDGRNIL